jgi:hypothetical protein
LMHVLVPIPSDDYDVLEQNIYSNQSFPVACYGE